MDGKNRILRHYSPTLVGLQATCARLLLGALIFLSGSVGAESTAPCEAEPTDMTISYGALVNCDVQVLGDTDLFRFDASAGETVVAQATMSDSADSHIELFDPDGLLVDSDSGFRDAQIRATLSKSGSHSILVRERDDNEISEYVLALERISPPSPGSPRVVFGAEAPDAIDALGDLDLYRFEASAGEAVAVQVTMASFSDSEIQLFDPDGFPVATDAAFHDARVDQMLAKTGTYTVLIKERDDNEVDSYLLALERTSECRGTAAIYLSGQTISATEIVQACDSVSAGDDYEVGAGGDVTFLTEGSVVLRDGFSVAAGGSLTVAAPAWGVPMAFGQDLQQVLAPQGDLAVFRFSGTAGETIVAQATMQDSADSRIELYDPDGFLLDEDDAFHDARVDVYLSETGLHTLLVKERDDNEISEFTLVLERIAPPSPDARPLCFGCVASDVIDPLGDIDLFVFDAAGTETISAQVTMLDSTDAQIELFDPDGLLVASDSGFSTALINTTLTTAGIHSLLVKERDDSETDGYDISLQCVGGCSQ